MSCSVSALVFFFKIQNSKLDFSFFGHPTWSLTEWLSASLWWWSALFQRRVRVPLTALPTFAVGEVGRHPRAGRDSGAGGRRADSRRQTVFATDAWWCRRLRPLTPSAVTGTPPAASATGTHTSLAGPVCLHLSHQLYIYGNLQKEFFAMVWQCRILRHCVLHGYRNNLEI